MALEETFSTDGAECPYCGHLNNPADGDGGLYNESLDEWECDDCGKAFNVDVYVSHSWTCTPYDDIETPA